MTTKPFFSGRIPQELFGHVEAHSKKTGLSKTDILIKALSIYLDRPVESDGLSNQELTERILKIEQRLKSLIAITSSDNPQQLPLFSDSSNSKDVVTGKIVTDKQDDQWKLIGEMRIPEIVALPFQTELGTNHLNTKIRNHFAKKDGEPKNKDLKIDHYLIRWARQEPGKKGAIIFEVSRK
jgi:hypothetical protein